jgi:hypothetical protein
MRVPMVAACAFLALCVVLPPLWARADEPAAPAGDEPLELDRLIGTQWYGIYVLERKAGYTWTSFERDERDGTPTVVERLSMRLAMQVGGEATTYTYEASRVFEARPPYRLLLIESEERTRDASDRLRVERQGDEFAVARVSRGRRTAKRVPASKETLRDRCAVSELVQRDAKPGETTTYVEFSLSAPEDRTHTAAVQEVVEEEWDGTRQRVFVVTQTDDGATRTMRYLEDGTLVHGVLNDVFELRLEDEKEAKRLPRRRELFEVRREVRVEGLDVKGDEIARLTLAIKGMPEGVLVESATQRVQPPSTQAQAEGDDGVLVVALTPSAVPGKPSISDEDRARLSEYLEATDEIQSEHRSIRRRARLIVDENADPLEQARAVCRWVHRHVRASAFSNYRTALDVLRHLEGDCTEDALLCVALCRAAGVPARQVDGFVYAGPAQRTFAMHRWAQVYVGSWVDVDPAYGQVPADATHIALDIAGEKWFALLKAFDALRIEVIEVERKPGL